MTTTYGEYELIVGLEVHAQLFTRTKAFCPCATSFGDPPNTHTCPVCLGLPGALPVLSREAVRMATSAALALGCEVRPRSIFARKNYFYPDLPKGYQISQYDEPLAIRGAIEIEMPDGVRRARILRVHMEEDAGKNVHGMGDESIVDLNRAGTPLVEIVGEPDLRSGAEASEYLKRLREILMFIGVNDGNLEQGSFRCDANVSVRKKGDPVLGTRTELKNINSFRFVADAIDVEARRQIALLSGGARIRQQTRGYNADKHETYTLRDKENESGYRYFPEPDLPPLLLDGAFLDEVWDSLPVGPAERRRQFIAELGLAPQAAGVLTGHPDIAAFFETAVFLYAGSTPTPGAAVRAANFIQNEVLRDTHVSGLVAELPVSPAQIAELLRLVDRGTISGKQAKEVYGLMRGSSSFPESIVAQRGMAVVSDERTLVSLARDVVAKNPKQAESYRAGKTNILGFFVGHMMKLTQGSADPAVVNLVLKRVLAGDVGTPSSSGNGATKDAQVSSRPPASAGAPATVEPATRPRKDQSPLAESVAPPPEKAPQEHTLTSALAAIELAAMRALPTSENVTRDAVAKVDVRVGRISGAARVPGWEALLEVLVDVGEDRGPRRIVQALALSFAPEELVDRLVLVVCNLEPRLEADGLVSEGALLAAGPAEGLSLATVAEQVRPGTAVR